MSTEFGRLLAEVLRSMDSGAVFEKLKAVMNIYEHNFKREAEVEALKAEHRWIPVSERMPEIGIRVLTSDVTGYISTDFIVELDMSLCTFHLQRKLVTHWMPLPQPPEVQE